MNLRKLMSGGIISAVLRAALLAPNASGQGSNEFGLFKQQAYFQTGPGTLGPFTSFPFSFSLLDSSAGSLTLPGGTAINLTPPSSPNHSDELADGFATEASLEAAFPNGTYTLASTGNPALTFTLGPSLYPASVPQVTNGSWKNGLLVVDPSSSVTLNFTTFNEYASAGKAGYSSFSLMNATGNDNVSLRKTNATMAIGNGTVSATPLTSFTIPAGSLTPGLAYFCTLEFDTIASFDTTTIPGDSAFLIYGNTLNFVVVARSPAPIPAPTIVTNPSDQTAPLGGSATFGAGATFGSGQRPPNTSVFWFFNGRSIDADGVKYVMNSGLDITVNSITAADAGSYSALIVTGGGVAFSNPATLTIGAAIAAPPVITTQPHPQTVATGGTVAFHVVATGAASYQWSFGGYPLQDGYGVSDVTGSTLVISGATPASAGSYSCAVSNSAGTTNSNPASLAVSATDDIGRLINISTRSQVGTGANILIAGFAIGGAGASGSEPVLIRASGPALIPFDVAGTLPDPQLQLFSGATSVATDNGWAGNAQVSAAAATVGAFSWGDPSSRDSALLVSPGAGAYTAQVSGAANDSGVALVEVYAATAQGSYTPSSPRLTNISARVPVGTGGNILIAGFVVGGSTSMTVLIRASGPALAEFAVAGTLPDPQLQLYSGTTLLATNAGWGGKAEITNTAASVGAFAWNDPTGNDSALLVTLPPGAYTAQVSGASGDTGVALIEVYEVP